MLDRSIPRNLRTLIFTVLSQDTRRSSELSTLIRTSSYDDDSSEEEIVVGGRSSRETSLRFTLFTSVPSTNTCRELASANTSSTNCPTDLDKRAFFMKETADAKRVHDHILRCFEEASFIHLLDGDETLSVEEEEEIRKVLSFVVVGGGPTGAEFCAELTDFLKTDIARQYPHLTSLWSVHLIDALPKILSPFQNDSLQDYAANHLAKNQGVQIHLSEFVDTVRDNEICLKSGKTFPFSTLVWCAGIKPLPFVAKLDMTKNERQSQLLTDRKCRVVGEEETGIFALGDCATMKDFFLPQTAQIAAQQGYYLAQALNSPLNANEYPNFQNEDRGTLAYDNGLLYIGGTNALYKTPGFLPIPNITGRLGYFTWRSAYWSMQLSVRNKVSLAWGWVFNHVFGRDLTRVGRHSSPVERADHVDVPMRTSSGKKRKA